MGWLFMIFAFLMLPFAFVKVMTQNLGLALIILAIIVISGIVEGL